MRIYEYDLLELLDLPIDIAATGLCHRAINTGENYPRFSYPEEVDEEQVVLEPVVKIVDLQIRDGLSIPYEELQKFVSNIKSSHDLTLFCQFNNVWNTPLPSDLEFLKLKIPNIDYNSLNILFNLTTLSLRNDRFPFQLFQKENILPNLEIFEMITPSFLENLLH